MDAHAAQPREEFASAARERFLIASGRRLSEAFDEEPSPSFFASARVKFLMAAQRMRLGQAPVREPRRLPVFGSAFRAFATAGAMAVVFLGFSTYTIATAQAALPGDWRYPVKLQTERVRLALAFSDDAKRDVHIDIAAERANEIQKLADKGRIIPPGVIEDLQEETAKLDQAVAEDKLDSGDLQRVAAITEKATSVLPEAKVEPKAEETRNEAVAAAESLSLKVGVAQVNHNDDGRPPVITPTDPLATAEPTRTPEPTATPASGETPVATPAQPSATPERTGLTVDETPASSEGGITWMRLAVDRLSALIPSEEDGWHISGINAAEGPAPSPNLVRITNSDGTQIITLNPRNGDMWWFVAVNGLFDEVQVRVTRDGQAFGVDRELLTRLYGPLAELPLFVLDSIELAPEPEPTVTPEASPTAAPSTP
jgi:hypothetical protein